MWLRDYKSQLPGSWLLFVLMCEIMYLLSRGVGDVYGTNQGFGATMMCKCFDIPSSATDLQ